VDLSASVMPRADALDVAFRCDPPRGAPRHRGGMSTGLRIRTCGSLSLK